jgi:hypothetical protein
MFGKLSRLVRLVGAIGAMVIATLIVVPMTVRAQHRLPHHDLAKHDPIPLRLRYNWNGETPAAKVKLAPQEKREVVAPLPAPTILSASTNRPACFRVSDDPVPACFLDRSPLLFRGPPASFLS